MNQTTSREHLSALMDGELDAEPARFLLRRMEREPELARAWSRWHLIRACLNAEHPQAAHADPVCIAAAAQNNDDAFAARVLQAVQVRSPRRHHWARYIGGGAIAASVAAAALILSVPQTPSDAGIAAAPNRTTAVPARVIATAPVSARGAAPLPWINDRQPMFLAARQNAANAALGGGLLQSDYLQQAAYAPDSMPLSAPLLMRGGNQNGNAPYMILLVPENGAAKQPQQH